MSKLSLVLFITFCLYSVPRSSLSEEVCFLDNSQVLLYKIINWWYYAADDLSKCAIRSGVKIITEPILNFVVTNLTDGSMLFKFNLSVPELNSPSGFKK